MNCHYQTYGTPRDCGVLFFHGFLGSGDDWLPIIDQLKSRYYCISLDMPGHGKTLIESSPKFTDFPNSVRKVMIKLGLKRMVLVGYSMGARLGLSVLSSLVDCIDLVILESVHPGLVTQSERDSRLIREQTIQHQLKRTSFDSFLTDWYDQPLFSKTRSHCNFDQLVQSRLNNDTDQLQLSLAYYGLSQQPNYWPLIQKNAQKVSIILGDSDQKFQQLIPSFQKVGIRPHLIKHAAHNTHFDNQAAYLDYLSTQLACL